MEFVVCRVGMNHMHFTRTHCSVNADVSRQHFVFTLHCDVKRRMEMRDEIRVHDTLFLKWCSFLNEN